MYAFIEVLLPYLFLFYLLEGFVLVRKGEYLLASTFGGSCRLLRAGIHLPLLFPSSRAFIGSLPRVLFGREGLFLCHDEQNLVKGIYREEDFRYFPYYAITDCTVQGRELRLNNLVSVALPPSVSLPRLTERIGDFLTAPQTARAAMATKIMQDRYDLAAAKSRWASGRTVGGRLAALGWLLFAVALMVWPVLLYGFPAPAPLFTITVIFFVAFYLGGIPALALAHRRLYGRERPCAGFLLTMLFSPMSVLHAQARLLRECFSSQASLVPAALFCTGKRLLSIAVLEANRIEIAQKYGRSSYWMEFWKQEKYNLTALLRQIAISRESLADGSRRRDESAVAQCPTCQAEFLAVINACPDCHIELQPYDAAGHTG
jgi:hypothetical protein